MPTVVRLSRGGAKKSPFYRIVVADSRKPRDGDFIERLGTFNPLLAKDNKARLVINEERAKHWFNVGAQPSERVARILADLGLTQKPSAEGKPQKARKKADKLNRREKAAAAEAEAKAQAEAEKAAAAAAPAEEAPAAPAAEEAPAA